MEKLDDKKEFLNKVVYAMVEGDDILEQAIKWAHEYYESFDFDTSDIIVKPMDERYILAQVAKYK